MTEDLKFFQAKAGPIASISWLDMINRSIPILVGIFVFFNPLPHTTSIKEVAFYSALGFMLVSACRKRTKVLLKTPPAVPLGLFVLWALVGLFFALDRQGSFHDVRAHLLRYVVLYYLILNTFHTQKKLKTLSWVIIISTALACVWGLWFYYGKLGYSLSARFGSDPHFSEIPVNQIGLITLFAIVLCAQHVLEEKRPWRKASLLLVVCLLIGATLLTQARSAVIALYCSGLVLFSGNKKALIGFLAVLTIIVGFSSVGKRFKTDITDNIRLQQHLLTLEVIKDYPVTGIGFGMKQYGKILDLDKYQQRLPKRFRSKRFMGIPHAMLMHVAVRTGLVGLLLFLWMLFCAFKTSWARVKHGSSRFVKEWSRALMAALVGFLVIGLFEPVFFHMGEAVFFTILAFTSVVWRIDGALET